VAIGLLGLPPVIELVEVEMLVSGVLADAVFVAARLSVRSGVERNRIFVRPSPSPAGV
jgi:hypothetical protein